MKLDYRRKKGNEVDLKAKALQKKDEKRSGGGGRMWLCCRVKHMYKGDETRR